MPLPFRKALHRGTVHVNPGPYASSAALYVRRLRARLELARTEAPREGRYSTAELARAHSVIRPPAPTGTSQPPFKVGHRRGRPTPREETTISPPGAPRARSYPPRRRHDDRGRGLQDLPLPRPLRPQAHQWRPQDGRGQARFRHPPHSGRETAHARSRRQSPHGANGRRKARALRSAVPKTPRKGVLLQLG